MNKRMTGMMLIFMIFTHPLFSEAMPSKNQIFDPADFQLPSTAVRDLSPPFNPGYAGSEIAFDTLGFILIGGGLLAIFGGIGLVGTGIASIVVSSLYAAGGWEGYRTGMIVSGIFFGITFTGCLTGLYLLSGFSGHIYAMIASFIVSGILFTAGLASGIALTSAYSDSLLSMPGVFTGVFWSWMGLGISSVFFLWSVIELMVLGYTIWKEKKDRLKPVDVEAGLDRIALVIRF